MFVHNVHQCIPYILIINALVLFEFLMAVSPPHKLLSARVITKFFHQRKKRILNCKIKLTCFFSFYEFTDALHQIRSTKDRWLQRKYLKTILKTTIDSARGRQTMIAKCPSLCPFTEKTIHRCTQNQNYLSEPTPSQPYTNHIPLWHKMIFV